MACVPADDLCHHRTLARHRAQRDARVGADAEGFNLIATHQPRRPVEVVEFRRSLEETAPATTRRDRYSQVSLLSRPHSSPNVPSSSGFPCSTHNRNIEELSSAMQTWQRAHWSHFEWSASRHYLSLDRRCGTPVVLPVPPAFTTCRRVVVRSFYFSVTNRTAASRGLVLFATAWHSRMPACASARSNPVREVAFPSP